MEEVSTNKKTLSFRRLKSISPNYFMYGMAVVVFMVGYKRFAIRSFMLDNKIAQIVSAQASNLEATSDVDEKPSDDDVRLYSVALTCRRNSGNSKACITGRVSGKCLSTRTGL